MSLDHFWSRLVDKRMVSVPDYNRVPNIAEREIPARPDRGNGR